MLHIPTLRTTRLRLEPLSAAHSAGMFDMWRSEDVCRYSGEAQDFEGNPITLPARTPGDSDKIIGFFVRSAAEGTRFRWAVIQQEGEAFTGAVGFNHLTPCAEVAYHFTPAHWHKGYAFEASEAALHWLQHRGTHTAIECFIDPANTPSAKLAERLGLKPTGEMSDGAERFVRDV